MNIADWRTDIRAVRHLYVHIPFCHRHCSYCDFNTYANMEHRMAAYTDALCAELALLAQNDPASATYQPLPPTIFLGGGTPSMLPLDQMERVLQAAGRVIPLETAEVTVECNPGTVLGRDYLRHLRGMGVNRISMGVQSLHDLTLRVLGRIHTAAEAYASFADARAAGFTRINLDFIFGLPGQTLEQWEATLQEIITWQTDHFSLYSLILEPQTPLHAQVMGGRLRVPDDDATGAMYELAIERLGAAGYEQYEISNWARSGQQCAHNLAYWLNVDYFACGAGAHGHLFPRRYADVLGIDDYIGRIQAGISPIADVTDLTLRDLMAETMFMGLRMQVGVSFAHFRALCGMELTEVYASELTDLTALGLLEQDATGVRLTPRGRMLGNRVFERFV